MHGDGGKQLNTTIGTIFIYIYIYIIYHLALSFWFALLVCNQSDSQYFAWYVEPPFLASRDHEFQ